MPEASGERFRSLQELGHQPGWAGGLPEPWRFSFARKNGVEFLCWAFHALETDRFPRGYLESWRQRHAQFASLKPSLSGDGVALFEGAPEEGIALLCPAIEGEPLPVYLARLKSLQEVAVFRLVLEVIQLLKPMVGVPRLLSNVALEDFFVSARDGVFLAVRFCPAFCLLREELPLSDFQIARKWTELMAKIHAYVKQGRKVPFQDIDPVAVKAFRPLFKDLDTGKDRTLEERLLRVEALFRAELKQTTKLESRLGFPTYRDEMPAGPLGEYLKQQIRSAHPEKLLPAPDEADRSVCFSPYLLPATSGAGAKDRLGYVLPPEQWFEQSLIDSVNRRLSHPFLKAHHNGTHIRSVYCDEDVTVLFGDNESGLPLPALLAAFDGVARGDLQLIVGKLHRALAQFDSAGFELSLSTPWQVELHIEKGVAHPLWETLLNEAIQAWPPWEVKLRMEKPTESFVRSESNASWNFVSDKLSGKFFPALVAWMLDWKRFQWASLQGNLKEEPLSWDRRLDALFLAAGAHLEPNHLGQREKFLSLVKEGIEASLKV